MQEKQDTILSAHRDAERAVDELRRQMGIVIQSDSGPQAIYPVEFLQESNLRQFHTIGQARLQLILTAARARSIGFATKETVQIEAEALSLAQIQFLADPLAQKTEMPNLDIQPATQSQKLVLKLAKQAALLPALIVIENASEGMFPVSIHEDTLLNALEHPQLEVIHAAEAKLPLDDAEDSRLVSFRTRFGSGVHLALIVGRPGDVPLVRVHSSCVTGDILGSLRCDCGDQLSLALEQLREKGGILIYLNQEGRGIGITNKLRAYRLQEQGYNTYEANLMLGFDEDERDFALAAAMLKDLGVTKIRLLTNNPEKLSAIEKAGMKVEERVPLVAKTGHHSHAYLEAKAKSGHLF